MTQIARLYGSSMYDLAAEEQLTDTVLEQMQTIRQHFPGESRLCEIVVRAFNPEGREDKTS